MIDSVDLGLEIDELKKDFLEPLFKQIEQRQTETTAALKELAAEVQKLRGRHEHN